MNEEYSETIESLSGKNERLTAIIDGLYEVVREMFGELQDQEKYRERLELLGVWRDEP